MFKLSACEVETHSNKYNCKYRVNKPMHIFPSPVNPLLQVHL